MEVLLTVVGRAAVAAMETATATRMTCLTAWRVAQASSLAFRLVGTSSAPTAGLVVAAAALVAPVPMAKRVAEAVAALRA